jgi:hypothetical protein
MMDSLYVISNGIEFKHLKKTLFLYCICIKLSVMFTYDSLLNMPFLLLFQDEQITQTFSCF